MLGLACWRKRVWKDAALSLSLANLCLLGGWEQIERTQLDYLTYFRKYPLANSLIAAHVLAILAMALVLWGGVIFVRWWGNRIVLKAAEYAFLLLLLVPLCVINAQFGALEIPGRLVIFGKTGLILLGATISSGPFLLALYRNRIVLRVAETLVLVLAPVFLVCGASVVANQARSPRAKSYLDKPAAPPLSTHNKVARIVWIVFDELDERLLYSERPAGLNLPEFDRLAGESVRAARAYPPASATIVSFPSLISGRLISQVDSSGPDELEITFRGSAKPVKWSAISSVFSQARSAGAKTALVGWNNPYCRIIGSSLSACSWEPTAESVNVQGAGIGVSLWAELRAASTAVPFVPHVGPIDPERIKDEASQEERRQHLQAYRHVRERALGFVADSQYDLVFLHWPVPHPVGIYNRAAGSFNDISHSNYVDNLALADRTLGELRRSMESAGQWDRSIVLVSSDHPLRPYIYDHLPTWTAEEQAVTGGRESPLIPFLVKMAGQHTPVTYKSGFNTVLSHDLVLASMKGELATPKSVVRWLDANRDRFPTH